MLKSDSVPFPQSDKKAAAAAFLDYFALSLISTLEPNQPIYCCPVTVCQKYLSETFCLTFSFSFGPFALLPKISI
jgi:hypothetical protein